MKISDIHQKRFQEHIDVAPQINKFGFSGYFFFRDNDPRKIDALALIRALKGTYMKKEIDYIYKSFHSSHKIHKKPYSQNEIEKSKLEWNKNKLDWIKVARKLTSSDDPTRFSIAVSKSYTNNLYAELSADENFIKERSQEEIIKSLVFSLKSYDISHFVLSPAFIGSLQSTQANTEMREVLQEEGQNLAIEFPFDRINSELDYFFWVNAFNKSYLSIEALTLIEKIKSFKMFEVINVDEFIIIKTKDILYTKVIKNEVKKIRNILRHLYLSIGFSKPEKIKNIEYKKDTIYYKLRHLFKNEN